MTDNVNYNNFDSLSSKPSYSGKETALPSNKVYEKTCEYLIPLLIPVTTAFVGKSSYSLQISFTVSILKIAIHFIKKSTLTCSQDPFLEVFSKFALQHAARIKQAHIAIIFPWEDAAFLGKSCCLIHLLSQLQGDVEQLALGDRCNVEQSLIVLSHLLQDK